MNKIENIEDQIKEEAANRARTRTNDESTSIVVDKQSILSIDFKHLLK